jgi:hypothetical protein
MSTLSTKSAWADLPNAKYIDLVLASMNKNPAAWDAAAAKDAAKDVAWTAAWAAARTAASAAARASDAARAAAWTAAWAAAWAAARTAASDAASDALLALIIWDNYGYLLEAKSEDVKNLALLGNHAAVLLYPACVALQNVKELEK